MADNQLMRWSLFSLMNNRHFNSSSLTEDAVLVDTRKEMDSDIASSLSALPDDALTTVTSLAEPTLKILGLGGWMPSGLIQSSLETLHIGLAVPWWTAIVIGTICIRIAIFPLVILAQRNAAAMHNHLPTMQRLQEKMTLARMSGDVQEAVKTGNDLMKYMQRHNVNPLRNLLVPLAQAPIFVSVFVGIREMTSLPVQSLQNGGIMWFTDLTVPDPLYVLPFITMSTLLATIEVGVDGVKAGQLGKNMKYILRAMPFVFFPFIIKFPAALLCYWFTSNAFSLVQVLFLRIPLVRKFFKIPELVNHSYAAPMKQRNLPQRSFMDGFRQTMTNIKLAAEMEERQRLNTLRLKESTKARLTSQKPTSSDTNKTVASKDK